MEVLYKFKKSCNKNAAYFFILPACSILLLFVLLPLIASLIMGFFNINIFFENTTFAGMNNFIRAMQDERFINALKNTVIFVAAEVPLQILLGLVVAALVSQTNLFSKMARSCYFVPVVCSMTAIGITWSMLLDSNIGLLPYLITKLGFEKISFFRDAKLAMPTIIIMTVWKNFGYTMSILVTGILGISKSYYEAATIDGASKIQQFFKITVPLLSQSIGFCIITNMIGSFQVFDQVYVTTQGGPLYKTETLVKYIYSTGFNAPYELGYSSAMSLMMFLIILICSLLMFKRISNKEAKDY